MERLKRVSGRGPHGIEEEYRVLLLLGMREGSFLLQLFDQVGVRGWERRRCRRPRRGRCAASGGGLRLVARLLLAGLARPIRRLRDGPREPGLRSVIGLVLAEDVERRFQGIERR